MMSPTDAIVRPHLTLLLGGARSGKSAKALRLARECEARGGVLFVATGEALDDEMRTRIRAHRAERPPTWDTLESPIELAADLERVIATRRKSYGSVVIDCLTLWVSNVLLTLGEDQDAEADITRRVERFLRISAAWAAYPRSNDTGSEPTRWIIVSNEVGLGVVPSTPLGRRYRDALGRVNQLVAAAADDVILMTAGIELPLKTASIQR